MGSYDILPSFTGCWLDDSLRFIIVFKKKRNSVFFGSLGIVVFVWYCVMFVLMFVGFSRLNEVLCENVLLSQHVTVHTVKFIKKGNYL